jgi:C-terminal processing protease CtpA/Prc
MYFVAGVAAQEGKKTVEEVEAGDRLISVDGMAVTDKTMGQVLAALHGTPGEARTVVLERRGEQIIAKAPITSF